MKVLSVIPVLTLLLLELMPVTKQAQKSVCDEPMDPGRKCEEQLRIAYEPDIKECVPFTFTSCGGNENNFRNYTDCEKTCLNGNGVQSSVCNETMDAGRTCEEKLHVYWDNSLEACTSFEYGGCGGNGNNFPDVQTCEAKCGNRRNGTYKE